MRVSDPHVGTERREALRDHHPGGLADVSCVPFVSQSEQQDSRTVDRALLPVQGQCQSGHDIVRHVRIDVVGQLDEPERLSDAPAHLPRQITGIDGQAVTPHSGPRSESEVAEWLGRRSVDCLPHVDTHGLGEHGQFVDQRDVHVAEGVLQQLGELGLPGAGNGHGAFDQPIEERLARPPTTPCRRPRPPSAY